MKRLIVLLLSIVLCAQPVFAEENTDDLSAETTTEEDRVETEDTEAIAGVQVSAPSALLMEASTGQVIFEKDADTKRPPASVTKIMTLLLIFDALEDGKIKLEDEVTTSEYAASMGGSQVFLEPGEVQTVDTLMKCIAVASANDACVTMAEYISGSEEVFVEQMNQRAKGLGMTNTHFVNCNGLDADGHLTTARDIALMSRELITTYPAIRDYCMIWQENITHTTKKGTSEFGLSNTNKLVRHYEYATGLKTGSTGEAKFCISATAEKNGMELIAVIMAADDSKLRNKDATTLLNYGFGKCNIYKEEKIVEIEPVEVKRGEEKQIKVTQEFPFRYVDVSGADLTGIERKVDIQELAAPIRKGEKVGVVRYFLNGEEIGSVDVVAAEGMKEIRYLGALQNLMERFFAM